MNDEKLSQIDSEEQNQKSVRIHSESQPVHAKVNPEASDVKIQGVYEEDTLKLTKRSVCEKGNQKGHSARWIIKRLMKIKVS